MRGRLSWALGLVSLVLRSAGAQGTMGFGPGDAGALDLAASRVFAVGRAPEAVSASVLRDVLAGDGRGAGWKQAPGATGVVHHVIAWTRPQPLGSVLVMDADQVAALRPGAAWPPDANDASAWEPLTVLGRSTGGTRLATTASPASVSALRVSRRGEKRDGLRTVWISPERVANAAASAVGHADAEYIVKPDMSPPYPLSVEGMLQGRRRWQNTGPDRNGRVTRPMVSEQAPSWVVLSWETPRNLLGLWLEGNARSVRIRRFTGPDGVNPVAGLRGEWTSVPGVRREGPSGRFLRFPEPLTTRAVRLDIERVDPVENSEAIAQVDGLMAFEALGAAPLPAVADEEEVPAPMAIPVEIATTGTVSVVVDTLDGRRIRNLTARQPVGPGLLKVPWDLKDEDGLFLGEGAYRWTALNVPELKVSYEMTPYPNVQMNSGNTPWLCGHSGPGGWMADHSAPSSVCAAGEWVVFGSGCAESGVALAACDRDGRKRWGHHNFIAWTGPQHLATDGEWIFAGAATGDADHVWKIPCKGGTGTQHLRATPTASRLRGLRGLAAAPERLYLSVAANGSDIFSRAATPADIDFAATLPFLRPAERASGAPDLRGDLARLFRLTGTPPGNSKGLIHIETTDMPASRQHMVLAFTRPVELGSLAFPMPGGKEFLRLAVLKPDAPWPPDPQQDGQWTEFHRGQGRGWTVIALPTRGQTRALRITFDRAEDEFEDLLDAPVGDALGVGDDLGVKVGATSRHAPWKGALEGMTLLRNRLEAVAETPEIRVNSGKVGPDGSWDAQRDRPLTADDPGVYTLAWSTPQVLRGLAIQEIDGKQTEIDVHVGPDGEGVNPEDEAQWESVATYEQKLRYYYQPDANHNSRARYMDGYVDFGRDITTRAVRLRVVEQWLVRAEGRAGCVGVRDDRGGTTIDATRCRIYGVCAVRLLDPEPEAQVLRTDRVEVYDGTGKPLAEWPLRRPGPLALARDGATLYAVSERQVVAFDTASGKAQPLPLDVLRPDGIAVDGAGLLYVYDRDRERLNVRVYEPGKGRLVRTIGTPGGYRAGPWDPTRFTSGPHARVALAVASDDRLWVVEGDFVGKRSSQWTLDGAFVREIVGTTRYGGGGSLDPWNKRRVYYDDGGATLAFDLDWTTGATRPVAVVGLGRHGGGIVPVRREGRQYLVTRTHFARQECGRVFLVTNDVARLVAAVGMADAFKELRTREVLAKVGRDPLEKFHFLWSDRNGDSGVQADEVELLPADGVLGQFDRELGIHSAARRYAVASVTADGVPLYKAQPLVGNLRGAGQGAFRLPGGQTVAMGPGIGGHAGFDAQSRRTWRWKTEGFGVHAYYSAGPYGPAQVTAEFDLVGAEQVPEGGLGGFYATSSNTGTWHLWSEDGILFGRLFQDLREPGRASWSMPEGPRGLDLTRVTLGQEHFSGYLCRTFEDDRYYAVAGHNHISVAAIEGLDKVRRMTGVVSVTPEIVREVAARGARDAQASLRRRAPVMRGFRSVQKVEADGVLDDWRGEPDAEFADGRVRFRIGYDDARLHVAWEIEGCGPFANSGNDWRRLFKTGAVVDLFLGTDGTADPRRRNAVRGDQRVLVAPFEGKPVAVLYRVVDPDAPADAAWETHTEVYRCGFDRVEILASARVGVQASTESGRPRYVVEASLPFADLGFQPGDEARLRFDAGVQEVGPDGNAVLQRLYWANQATRILSDEAAEAMLQPEQWGDLLLLGTRSMAAGRPANVLDQDPAKQDIDKLMDAALGD